MKIINMLKVLFAIRQMRRNERFSRTQLKEFQGRSVQKLRKYAYTHSSFYQKFHKNLTDKPLNELPVLTKAMLMENFDDLVTDPKIRLGKVREFVAQFNDSNSGKKLYLDRYTITATSGSSGQPGFFLFNESEWISIIASFARGQEWSGKRVGLLPRRKMAMVASISPWHMSSCVAVSANTWATPSIRIATTTALDIMVSRLNEYQPDLLVVYPSMAAILATEQIAGRLHVKPDIIFTSAELLTRQTRRRIKQAWNDEPFNQYGSTETAEISAEFKTCRRMHIFEDLLIVENVDEKNRPVPQGEYGAKLLITTLFRRTQPLIRYEVNDSVKLDSDACPKCNLPFAVLDNIQGRKEDALYLPGLTEKQVLIQPNVFDRIMDILPVSGWQVVRLQTIR